uniref:Uncharacterized protein n=1 Tax=Rhizophora mucronata TaxID=61149 RepID=A0A2P2JT57_RHIMU
MKIQLIAVEFASSLISYPNLKSIGSQINQLTFSHNERNYRIYGECKRSFNKNLKTGTTFL